MRWNVVLNVRLNVSLGHNLVKPFYVSFETRVKQSKFKLNYNHMVKVFQYGVLFNDNYENIIAFLAVNGSKWYFGNRKEVQLP